MTSYRPMNLLPFISDTENRVPDPAKEAKPAKIVSSLSSFSGISRPGSVDSNRRDVLSSGNCVAWDREDWHAFFAERAGIAEFDGGRSRAEAEVLAFECCVVEWLNRHPHRSDDGRCAWCQEPDFDGHVVVPFGTADHGHAWLHTKCWNDWHRRRREQAQRCLAGIGVKVPSGTSERIEFPENSTKSGASRQAKFFNEQKAK